MIARRSLCPEKLGSNPGTAVSKGINFSGWHGLDMSITVTKRRVNSNKQNLNPRTDVHGGKYKCSLADQVQSCVQYICSKMWSVLGSVSSRCLYVLKCGMY